MAFSSVASEVAFVLSRVLFALVVGYLALGNLLDLESSVGYARQKGVPLAAITVPLGSLGLVAGAFALYGVMFASFTLVFGGLYTTLPFYLSGAFGFSAATVGLVTSTVLLVTAAISTQNGRLTARSSKTTLLTAGFGLYAVGLAGIALAATPVVLVAGLLVFGVGSGLVTPTLFAAISSLAPDVVRGGVMSLQTLTIGVSQALGPVVFTILAGAVGSHTDCCDSLPPWHRNPGVSGREASENTTASRK